MTIDLILFLSIVGILFLFNVISLWAITRLKDNQLHALKRTWNRLNYIEVALSYHGMIPLPWDEVDISENKSFKKEGNVVYLHNEET